MGNCEGSVISFRLYMLWPCEVKKNCGREHLHHLLLHCSHTAAALRHRLKQCRRLPPGDLALTSPSTIFATPHPRHLFTVTTASRARCHLFASFAISSHASGLENSVEAIGGEGLGRVERDIQLHQRGLLCVVPA